MDRRRMTPFVACLMVGGLSSCAVVEQLARDSGDPAVTRFVNDQAEASRRSAEIEKECKALEARAISVEEEYAFGGAVSVNWVSQGGGLIQSSDAKAVHEQLNKIGKNLAAQSSRPTLPWTFGVLQSKSVNAVSGPGGYVFVSEGLLAQLDNEAQLAGVLAHEIAHITGKHAVNEYQKLLVSQCRSSAKAEHVKAGLNSVKELGLGLPPGELRDLFRHLTANAGFDNLSDAAIKALTDNFIKRISEQGLRKEDEFEADQEAVELMAAAGYAPWEYVAFLAKLPDSGLSTTHPQKKDRRDRLIAHLKKLNAPAKDDEFTTSVDLSQTKIVPLRDALQARRTGTAARTD
jgi:predicted Zn-dependent protease